MFLSQDNEALLNVLNYASEEQLQNAVQKLLFYASDLEALMIMGNYKKDETNNNKKLFLCRSRQPLSQKINRNQKKLKTWSMAIAQAPPAKTTPAF